MDKKKILLVTMSFFPENSPRSFRATELAKEFGKQGHSVNIITERREYDYSEFEKKNNCTVRSELRLQKYRSDIFMKKRNIFVKIKDRFLYQFFLYPEVEISKRITDALKGNKGKYDIVISIAKPYSVHIGCAIALRKNRELARTWIADCGDPFTLCKSDVYKFPFYIKWLEKWMFRRTDFISVPVEAAINGYYKEFHRKIRVIPQGFNFNAVKLYKGEINNSCPTFCYAGALYSKTRNPAKLMQYLGDIRDEFRFIVYTGTPGLLEPYKDTFGEKLIVKKPVPREELLFELSKMNFLLNIDNVYKEQVPSKLIDYMMTGRPILNIEPENPDYSNIDRFLKGDYSGKYSLGKMDDYDISTITKKILSLNES